MIFQIRGQIVNPPTIILCFRLLTLKLKENREDVVLLETDNADMYYKWLKPLGGMDFVDDILGIDEEFHGIRIDSKPRKLRPVIRVDKIVPENIHNILDTVKLLRS